MLKLSLTPNVGRVINNFVDKYPETNVRVMALPMKYSDRFVVRKSKERNDLLNESFISHLNCLFVPLNQLHKNKYFTSNGSHLTWLGRVQLAT